MAPTCLRAGRMIAIHRHANKLDFSPSIRYIVLVNTIIVPYYRFLTIYSTNGAITIGQRREWDKGLFPKPPQKRCLKTSLGKNIQARSCIGIKGRKRDEINGPS